MRLLTASLAVAAIATSANARPADLCSALSTLRSEAERTGTPQSVAIIKEEAMAVACSHRTTAEQAFCGPAIEAAGFEFVHVFPWRIYDCLMGEGLHPEIEIADQYTGSDRKKLLHLVARWARQATIEVTYKPRGDFSDASQFKGYWGEYQVVISPGVRRTRDPKPAGRAGP